MLNGIADKGFSFLRQATSNWQYLGPAISALVPSQFDTDPAAACAALQNYYDLAALNTTILNASYYENTTEVDTLGSCLPTAQVSVPLCRVQFVVNTSDVSAITAEAWLPTEWSGRFLGLGNGGLGGCIDYENLGYGSSLGFAAVASNNGHDGSTGVTLTNPEVLADFTSRAVHVATVVGKQLAATNYGRAHRRAYYLGCSTGGRQGVYAALYHPEDFDGIVAGAPATNFNYLQGWSAMITKYIGAPDGEASPSFIPPALWDVVAAEVLRQCDALDGLVDGIITEPDACEFRPEELQCAVGKSATDCLTKVQVEALRKIYAPLYGASGKLLFPRFDPGAEASPYAQAIMFSGNPFPYSDDWTKYVVHNDSNYDYRNIGLEDIALSEELDPGKISTFNGDLSTFRARGGKLISYHGRNDPLIPSGNAKSLYNLVARTLGLHTEVLDEFYRLFLIPGMDHCTGGPGAVNFGQDAQAILHLEDRKEEEEGRVEKEKRDAVSIHEADNVLLALVDWVERGSAPDTITGVSDDGKVTRAHCRYPQRSVWDGGEYSCVA